MRKKYTFEVTGTGKFPVDMLRYDCCWPAREGTDTRPILGDNDDGSLKVQTIRLESHKEPTTRRWQSFGWRVEILMAERVP